MAELGELQTKHYSKGCQRGNKPAGDAELGKEQILKAMLVQKLRMRHGAKHTQNGVKVCWKIKVPPSSPTSLTDI